MLPAASCSARKSSQQLLFAAGPPTPVTYSRRLLQRCEAIAVTSFRIPGPLGSSSAAMPAMEPGTMALSVRGAPSIVRHAPAAAPAAGESQGVVTDVFDELYAELLRQFQLPHNRTALRDLAAPKAPEEAARDKVKEVRSGLASVRRTKVTGPRTFLRVVGATNRAYSGEWWFDVELLETIEKNLSRLFLPNQDRNEVVRMVLREVLAVSAEWNQMTEVWCLDVPKAESLKAYIGPGAPQQLFANLPLSNKGNRALAGSADQYFFVVKNPMWVTRYDVLLKQPGY
jgi:hypothetical protein